MTHAGQPVSLARTKVTFPTAMGIHQDGAAGSLELSKLPSETSVSADANDGRENDNDIGNANVNTQQTPTPTATVTAAATNYLDEKLYDLPLWRKYIILFAVSWMTLVITFSSTSLLPAAPEIASEFTTTTTIINITNAGVLVAMGISSFIWGPIAVLLGRKNAYLAAILVLCGCSVGTALAPNMRVFTALRILGGLTGTYFMVAGQTILADIFEPVFYLSLFLLDSLLYIYALLII